MEAELLSAVKRPSVNTGALGNHRVGVTRPLTQLVTSCKLLMVLHLCAGTGGAVCSGAVCSCPLKGRQDSLIDFITGVREFAKSDY